MVQGFSLRLLCLFSNSFQLKFFIYSLYIHIYIFYIFFHCTVGSLICAGWLLWDVAPGLIVQHTLCAYTELFEVYINGFSLASMSERDHRHWYCDRSVVLTLDDRPDSQLWGHCRSTHNSSMICFSVFAVVSLWHPGDGRDVRKKTLPYNYFFTSLF